MRSHENEEEPSQKKHTHLDEWEPSQKKPTHEDEGGSSQKLKQVWFHCPHTVIACRIQCGDENERLLDLVSKVIVSKYTLPGHRVRIIPSSRTQDLDDSIIWSSLSIVVYLWQFSLCILSA